MDRKIALAWADDLESDRYPQGRKVLRQGDKYCCLGVLSERAVSAGIARRGEAGRNDIYTYFGRGDAPTATALSDSIMAWAGIKSVSVIVRLSDGVMDRLEEQGFNYVPRATTLADLNDQEIPFSEIARIIRKHYEEL